MSIDIQTAHSTLRNQRGVVALLTIIVVGAVTLLIAQSASILGLGELDIGYTAQKGGEALAAADGCMEETFRRVRLDTNYGVAAGSIDLPLSNGSCTIDVGDLGGGQRQVTVSATVDEFTKKIEAVVTLSGNIITINSWRERED